VNAARAVQPAGTSRPLTTTVNNNSAVPIVVGVSAHRDLAVEAEAPLRERFGEILDRLASTTVSGVIRRVAIPYSAVRATATVNPKYSDLL